MMNRNYNLLQWLGHHESLATSCDFCAVQPGGAVVIVGLEDGSYCTWDTRMKNPVKTVQGEQRDLPYCTRSK